MDDEPRTGFGASTINGFEPMLMPWCSLSGGKWGIHASRVRTPVIAHQQITTHGRSDLCAFAQLAFCSGDARRARFPGY
jgi:hypothetical protein